MEITDIIRIVLIGFVVLGLGGTLYFVHKRSK